MNRILVVDDAEDIHKIVTAALRSQFEVVSATTLTEALSLVQSKAFDLLLLDVMLADGSGFIFYTQLQEQSLNPEILIVFLTGKNDVNDRITGYSLGAVDYISKPVDPLELQVRIESNLKRRGILTKSHVLQKGDLRFDLKQRRVALVRPNGETKLSLTATEYSLLFYFIQREDQVLSRKQILSAVWPNRIQGNRLVDVYISGLRSKLLSSHFTIQSIYGSGYVLCKRNNLSGVG